jgi:hypothetical protein
MRRQRERLVLIGLPVLLLAAAIAVRIGIAVWMAGDTDLTVWGDRDLWRALDVGTAWPVLGPEINGGARPPGGFFYYLLAALLTAGPSVRTANIGLILMFSASALAIGWDVGRRISARAGLLAAAIFAGSPMLAEVLKVWNPGYVPLFATLATLAAGRHLRTRGISSLALAVTAVALGMQIHLQMAMLGAGLTLAVAVSRPRWDHRHLLTLVLAFGLPFLPILAGWEWSPIATSVPLPQGAVSNYVFWEFDPVEKLSLAFALLGGSFDNMRYPPLVLAADLMVALLSAIGIGIALLSRFNRRADPESADLWLVSLSVLTVFLVEILFSAVNARHLVAALPAAAILGGLAVERAFSCAGRVRLVALALAALAVAAAGLRPLEIAAEGWGGRAGPFSAGSVAAQAELAALVKGAASWDRETFEARTALFFRSPSNTWQLAQEGVAGQMAFVFRTTAAAALPVLGRPLSNDECLAVVRRDEASPDAGRELARSQAFSGLAPSFSATLAESTHFRLLPYRMSDGNCLKSFPNAYLATSLERKMLLPGTAPKAERAATGAVFAVDLPGQVFPVGVSLDGAADGYRATLSGRLLRGYTGLHFASIVQPSLCFDDGEGAVLIPVSRLVIGSPQKGTLAPWQSAAFRLADGAYRLWLVGRDAKSPQMMVLPLGHLRLPQWEVAAPDGSGDNLPTACGGGR